MGEGRGDGERTAESAREDGEKEVVWGGEADLRGGWGGR